MSPLTKTHLLNRLTAGDPGWPVFRELVERVESLSFTERSDEFHGRFLVSAAPLVFADPPSRLRWPDWIPTFVPALYGLQADDPEMEGGYAKHFFGNCARRGGVFSPAANDKELGYPVFDVPPDIYHFQANQSGAMFFVDLSSRVLYPDVNLCQLVVMDSLEQFTQNVIRAALDGKDWFRGYSSRVKGLVD